MQNKEIEEQLNILIEERPTNKKEDALDNIKQYIQQLETKQQKVIDYLEKEKYTIESTYSQISGNYFMAQDRLDLINRVLEIMKGEECE